MAPINPTDNKFPSGMNANIAAPRYAIKAVPALVAKFVINISFSRPKFLISKMKEEG